MAEDSSVTGDPALLQNAFLNLGINARDAMSNRGVLLYSTKNVTIDETDHPGLESGRYIQIIVSDTGKGAIFKILIPVENTAVITSTAFDNDIVHGTGCILIIDDEAIIRNIAHAQLTHMGYDVLLAGDGEEGIELFKKETSRISLVIIDLVIPKISGQETLRRILEIAPGTKIILSSGFNYYEKNNQLSELGAAGFIQKPFQISRLSRIVYDIINGSKI